MKKWLSLILVGILACGSLVGCGDNVSQKEAVKQEEKIHTEENQKEIVASEKDYEKLILEETDTQVTFIDGAGNQKTITKKPEKTVILLNSILDLWYLVGGEAVARVSGESNVPEAAKNITDMGSFNKVSVEALLALEPNLVIMHTTNSQTQFADILDQNGIEWAVIDASTKAYEAFQNNAYIFSKILGTENLFEEKVIPVVETCEELIEKTNMIDEKPSVAVLYSTSKDIKVDTDNSSIGEMTSLLGAKNIVNAEDILIEGETRVAFSFEKLIEANPDYILISTMGDVDGVKEKIAKDLESNPAWNALKAVQNNEVHYLPKDLFVYKPNARYNEAFSYLVDILFKGKMN